MEHLTLRRVHSPKDIALTARLAEGIWSEHYENMLGTGQTAYMLAMFQSETAISRQILGGAVYKIAYYDNEPVGYYSIERQPPRMLLGMIYLQKQYRGRGIARAMLEDIVTQCRGLEEIVLNVNRNNAGPIAAYQKMGFTVCGEKKTDIGAGYIMEDYVMCLPLHTKVPQ